MAKIDWDKYVVYDPRVKKKPHIDWDKYVVPDDPIRTDKDYHWWHNLAAGAVDPLINVVNLGLKGIESLSPQKVGVDQTITRPSYRIPDIPYNPGFASTLGEIGGFAIPYVGQEKAAMAGIEGAQKFLPLLEKLKAIAPLRTAGTIGRGAALGASTGALTANQSDNRRSSALGGALGGGIGETAGQLLRQAGLGLGRIGVKDKLNRLFQYHTYPYANMIMDETPEDRMLNTIGTHYINALNKTKPLYDEVFNTLGEEGRQMSPTDFAQLRPRDLTSYKRELDKMTPTERRKLQYTSSHSFLPSGAYNLAEEASKPLYDKIFDEIDRKGDFMEPEDLKSFQNRLGSLTDPQRSAVRYSSPEALTSKDLEAIDPQTVHDYMQSLKYSDESPRALSYGVNKDIADSLEMDLKSFFNKKGLGSEYQAANEVFDKALNDIKPERVHYFLSDLKNQMRKIGINHPNYNVLRGAHDALSKDFDRFLKKARVKHAYDVANYEFKKNVVPFREEKQFRNRIMPYLDKSTNVDDGYYTHHGYVPGIDTAQTAQGLLPASTDPTMESFKRLEKLHGNDVEAAKENARNVLYSKYLRRNADGHLVLQLPSFLKRESAFSNAQRNWLFNNSDQKTLDTLRKLNVDRLSPEKKNLFYRAAGFLLGKMIKGHPKTGAVTGAIAAPSIVKGVEQGISSIFSPNDIKELVEHINTHPKGAAAGGSAAEIGAFLGTREGRGESE